MDEQAIASLKVAIDSAYASLNLEGNFLCGSTVKEILEAVATKAKKSIKEINIRNNYLNSDGVEIIRDLMEDGAVNLKSLDLRCNLLSHADIRQLVDALRNNYSITDFKIYENFGKNQKAPFFVYLKQNAEEDELQWDAFTDESLAENFEIIMDLVASNSRVLEVSQKYF